MGGHGGLLVSIWREASSGLIIRDTSILRCAECPCEEPAELCTYCDDEITTASVTFSGIVDHTDIFMTTYEYSRLNGTHVLQDFVGTNCSTSESFASPGGNVDAYTVSLTVEEPATDGGTTRYWVVLGLVGGTTRESGWREAASAGAGTAPTCKATHGISHSYVTNLPSAAFSPSTATATVG